ncbi:MAG: hypothetical protein J6S14_12185 [Clostridia bacterium]|nr:hypothetical protein [Clostridia bacterium]
MSDIRKLYILRIEEETIKYINHEKYRLITPNYALVLTKETPSVPCAEITAEEVNDLPLNCQEWLVQCIVAMAEQEVNENPQKVLDAQYEFLEEFERELEAEKIKWEESNGGTESRRGDKD